MGSTVGQSTAVNELWRASTTRSADWCHRHGLFHGYTLCPDLAQLLDKCVRAWVKPWGSLSQKGGPEGKMTSLQSSYKLVVVLFSRPETGVGVRWGRCWLCRSGMKPTPQSPSGFMEPHKASDGTSPGPRWRRKEWRYLPHQAWYGK